MGHPIPSYSGGIGHPVESRPRIDAGLVAEALDLTPAESRLATMVAVGQTVRDIAEMTGRTEATVRRHLKEIFRKQGISRQADLARLVLSLDGFPRSRRYWKHKLP